MRAAGAAAAPAQEGSAAASPQRWETDAGERVRSVIRRYGRPLADLIAHDANEGDTRVLVTDFLCEGLGYDKYDLTCDTIGRLEGVRLGDLRFPGLL